MLITVRKFTRQRVERSILPAHRTYLHVTGPHLRRAYVTYMHTLPRGKFLRETPRRCVRRLPRCVIILSVHSRVPTNRLSFIMNPKVTHARWRRNRYIRGLSCFRILSWTHTVGRQYCELLNRKWFGIKPKCKQKIHLRRKLYVTWNHGNKLFFLFWQKD